MTDLLEKAFANASKLPPREQDVIAKWLLAEIEVDARWDQGCAMGSGIREVAFGFGHARFRGVKRIERW